MHGTIFSLINTASCNTILNILEALLPITTIRVVLLAQHSSRLLVLTDKTRWLPNSRGAIWGAGFMQLVSQEKNSRADRRVRWYEKQVYLAPESLAHQTPGEHQSSFLRAQSNCDCATSNCLQPPSSAILPCHGVESSSPSSPGHGSLSSCKGLLCSGCPASSSQAFLWICICLVRSLVTSTIGTLVPLSAQCPQQHVGFARSLALQCGPVVTLGISPEREAHSLPVTLRQAGRAQRMFWMTSSNGYDQMTIFLSPRESGSWRSLL